jgi:hypothetical protein
MRRPPSVREMTYGPLQIGASVTTSSKGLSGAHRRENTGISVAILNSASFVRSRISKRTVRSSTTTAFCATPRLDCQGDARGPPARSKLNFTSSASTGSPFEKRACGCSRNVMAERSGATSMASASSPYIVMRSSLPRQASVSCTKCCRPAGASPFSVK